MTITFRVAQHDSKAFDWTGQTRVGSAYSVLKEALKSCEGSVRSQEMLQSSMDPDFEGNFFSFGSFVPKKNGFIHSVVDAYNRHQNLALRPDDIWIAIIAQLNFYVNAHAEELRTSFVSHEGQKEIKFLMDGSRYNQDYGAIANFFSDKLMDNILDPSLYDLLIPKISTTTTTDVIVASAMMLSTLQAYFKYVVRAKCGIPSITLLGTQADYMMMLSRLDTLDLLAPDAPSTAELRAFTALLRPIFRQCIAAFDAVAVGLQPDPEFWGRICHYKKGGSGPPDRLGGWITAFCVWTSKGIWQGGDLKNLNEPLEITDQNVVNSSPLSQLYYSGVRYPIVTAIPNGFCEVPIKIEERDKTYECVLLAGHVGMTVTATSSDTQDTLQPAAHWFMFVKGTTSF